MTNPSNVNAESMESIQQVANFIHQNMTVTMDYPTRNPNNWLPSLFIEIWLEIMVNRVQLLRSYYVKPITPKYVVHKKSALSENMKISILIAILG